MIFEGKLILSDLCVKFVLQELFKKQETNNVQSVEKVDDRGATAPKNKSFFHKCYCTLISQIAFSQRIAWSVPMPRFPDPQFPIKMT